jgi:hypothetical protein
VSSHEAESASVPAAPSTADVIVEQEGQGRNRLLAILIVVGVLLLLIGLLVFLYSLGGPDESSLEKLRDVTIVFVGWIWVIIVLLLAAMLGVIVWLALLMKNRVLPLLEEILVSVRETTGTVGDTAKRVKGTGEFVTDSVASPIITFYGRVARVRALTRTFAVKPKRPPRGPEPGA